MDDRKDPLLNAARGRDACGINHDELIQPAYEDGYAAGYAKAIQDASQVCDRRTDELYDARLPGSDVADDCAELIRATGARYLKKLLG
jgi:hypothetical protein